MSDLFERNQYTIRRKVLKLFGASFQVFVGQQPVGFCNQKAFKLKEDIRIYSDESQSTPLMEIRARKIIDFAAAYDIVDSRDGTKVGAARRKGMSSILRDSWEMLDVNDQPIARLQEDSAGLALVRRFLTNLIPQSFDLTSDAGHIADFKQQFNPFIYRLVVTIDPGSSIDRRLVFATAVLIASIEGRQN